LAGQSLKPGRRDRSAGCAAAAGKLVLPFADNFENSGRFRDAE